MTIANSPISWLYVLFIHSQNETYSISLSRLKVADSLHSGASISVLIVPTYMMLTQPLKICTHDQHHTSETLTIESQSEIPVKQCTFVTCFSSREQKPWNSNILFALADKKWKNLGTPFLRNTNKLKRFKISPWP